MVEIKQATEKLAEYAGPAAPSYNVPSSATLKSVTRSTIIWYYSGDAMIGDEDKRKQYTMEQEMTYQRL